MPDATTLIEKLRIHPFGLDRPITFKNIEEVRHWLNKEQANWGTFHSKAINFNFQNSENIAREHHRKLNLAIKCCNNFLKSTEGKSQEEINSLHSQTIASVQALEHPPYLASESSGAKEVFGSPEAHPYTGITILSLWAGAPLAGDILSRTDLTTVLRATALWKTNDFGTSAEIARRRKAANAALAEWDKSFKALIERGHAMLTHIDNEIAGSVRRHSEAGAALEKLHASTQERLHALEQERSTALVNLEGNKATALDTLLKERGDSLTNLEETFREHLRLKAPADYWVNKAGKHRQAAKRWLIGVISLSSLGIIAAVGGFIPMLSWLDNLKTQPLATASLVLLAVPALLYVSLIRVAHRSYRDEVRQTDDAEQRATLVQTYLALVHEDKSGIQPGERLLALHALFRGSAQFDAPDDTPPVNALEALLQTLKSKSGPP